jgi:hypothetical protein
MLRHLRQQARRELLAESRKHAISAKLRQIPYLGPIRRSPSTGVLNFDGASIVSGTGDESLASSTVPNQSWGGT